MRVAFVLFAQLPKGSQGEGYHYASSGRLHLHLSEVAQHVTLRLTVLVSSCPDHNERSHLTSRSSRETPTEPKYSQSVIAKYVNMASQKAFHVWACETV